MPDGTVFPALDGSTPGDNPDSGQIMEGPLPDLFGGGLQEQSGVTREPGPGAIQPFAEAPPASPAQSVDPALADVGDTVRRSGVQSRIDKLTRQKYEAQRAAAAQSDQIAALNFQLSQLNAKFSQLNSPRAPATALPGSSSDPLSGVGADVSARSGNFDEGAIARVIDERLAPLTNQLQSNQRLAALRAAQEQSFQDAAEEWSDLRDSNSEFRREFNQLFDSSPLKTLPDGPMQVAAQVRGILADRRRESQVVSERKRAAGITSSTPAAQPAAAGIDGLPRDVAANYDAAKARMRDGNASIQDEMLVMKVNRFKNQRKVGV